MKWIFVGVALLLVAATLYLFITNKAWPLTLGMAIFTLLLDIAIDKK
jgi:hypothetical protein